MKQVFQLVSLHSLSDTSTTAEHRINTTTLLHLVYLVLRGIVITDHNAEFLGQVLKSNHTLQGLDIVQSSLSDEGFDIILDSLKYTTTFKKLRICYNLNIDISVKRINRARKERGLLEMYASEIQEMKKVTFLSAEDTMLQPQSEMHWIISTIDYKF